MKKAQNNQQTLNSSQQKAVAIDLGPALIIAGAGTGKTRVIVERITRLVHEGVKPKNILALTFTEKAAIEMLDRTLELLGTYQLEMPIMTFNAFGESLLRQYAADIGLGRNFTLMGDSSQIVFLRERIDQLQLDYFSPVSNPDGMLGDIASYFSRLKQNVITPDEYKKFVQSMPKTDEADQSEHAKHDELARAYGLYMTLCREAGVIDYDDQLYLVIELLRRRPNVQQEVQKNYTYIMVDEFQDTNVMQSVLIDMLAEKNQNVFVVGDDDQSIYGWRGATLENILDFKKRYPSACEVTLTENYRTTTEILDSAYKLIQHNNPHRLEAQLKINKKLLAQSSGSKPTICNFETIDEELQWIAQDVSKRITAGADPGSIAILARRNTTVGLMQSYLDHYDLAYTVAGQRYDLYREPVVRTLLEALRCASDPLDNVSLYHTLIGSLFSLPIENLSKFNRTARKEHTTLLNILADHDDSGIQAALRLVKNWQSKAGTLSVGRLAYEIIDESGYKDRLYRIADDAVAALAGPRLSELFRNFKEFERIAIQPTVIQYVEALPALMASNPGGDDGTLDLSGQTVNLLTVHRSKGLEWPVVYILDCTENSFPTKEMSRGISIPDNLLSGRRSEADTHMAEERRLMYVAMTRAKRELILTYSQRHNGSTVRKPSRFLVEACANEPIIVPKNPQYIGFDSLTRYGNITNTTSSLPPGMLKNNVLNLSVSQIKSYLDCPLNFYYSYVLAVPEEPSASLEYGTLMHSLVEDMNRSLQTGKLLPLSELEKRLHDEWPVSGYLSKGHKIRALTQARQSLAQLYVRFQATPRIPLAIEEPFVCNLTDLKLCVRGRFDAILSLDNGVEIVDYKTGTSVKTPEKAKQRATSSHQLTLYALAWYLAHDEIPKRVSLDFLDTGQIGSVGKTQRGLDGMISKLRSVADGIRAHDFKPSGDHSFCKHPDI